MILPDQLPLDELPPCVDNNADGDIVFVKIDDEGKSHVPSNAREMLIWQTGAFEQQIMALHEDGIDSAYEVWDNAGAHGFVYSKEGKWHAGHLDDHYPIIHYLIHGPFPTRKHAAGALIYVDDHFITPIETGKVKPEMVISARPILGPADEQAKHVQAQAYETGSSPAGMLLHDL